MFHFLRQGKRPHEVAQIVGQSMKLETNLVVAEPSNKNAGGTATIAVDLSAIAVYCLCLDDAKNMTGTK